VAFSRGIDGGRRPTELLEALDVGAGDRSGAPPFCESLQEAWGGEMEVRKLIKAI
jgi:hypothetical protein